MKFGITFSHKYLSDLKLSVIDALDLALSMKFSIIRLGCYWSEIEKKENRYDFTELNRILDQCERVGQNIVMNVGVKSPRWPEFYWPEFVKEKNFSIEESVNRLNKFVEVVIQELKRYKCITMWQIENEPLDPSGPDNIIIPIEILEKEIEIVRNIDLRPILLTAWGNDVRKRKTVDFLIDMGNYVGLDIYYKVYNRKFLGKNWYSKPETSKNFYKKLVKQEPDKILIAELQAEPWEPEHKAYKNFNNGSMSVDILKANIEKMETIGFQDVWLWGFEYWYYQYSVGNVGYIDLIKNICL